ncbi:MAG TPA: HupE/UreJ family protein [Polyangia bacterium]|nr:HupE/UreJ family protein [Polyangia bacterium]
MTRGRRTAASRAALVAIALAALPGRAHAHDLDSGSLSLDEVAAGQFAVRWRASSRALQNDVATAVAFPPGCRLVGGGGLLACGAGGLVGALRFPWLPGSMTRVMVDVHWRDGTRVLRVASAATPEVRVYGGAVSRWRALRAIAADYTRLGVEHILTGFDHLLFVIALVLLVRGARQQLATVTAFTLAHSVSLAATVMGLVRVPAPPVEACIALSIVLVCAECLRPGVSLTRRAPWAVAFAFGLLHGLGFASALLELGVPEQHLPAALLCFNLGVELGQLAVVAAVSGLRAAVGRLGGDRGWMRPALIYAMGTAAAYWSVERIGAVLAP